LPSIEYLLRIAFLRKVCLSIFFPWFVLYFLIFFSHFTALSVWNCLFRKDLHSVICLYLSSFFHIFQCFVVYFPLIFWLFDQISLIYLCGIAHFENLYFSICQLDQMMFRSHIWTWIKYFWHLLQEKQWILIGHQSHQRTLAFCHCSFSEKSVSLYFFFDFLAIFSHFIGFYGFMHLELPVQEIYTPLFVNFNRDTIFVQCKI